MKNLIEILKKMPMFQNDPMLLERFNAELKEAQKVGRRKNYDLPKTPANVQAAQNFKVGLITPEQFLDIVGIKQSGGQNPSDSNLSRAKQYAFGLL